MTKVEQNAEIWAGDDVVLRFSILDSSGDAQDMTGNTASWVMQDEYNSTCITTSASGLITGSVIDIAVTGSGHTNGLSGYYYHELAATASGSAITLSTGTIKINRSNI